MIDHDEDMRWTRDMLGPANPVSVRSTLLERLNSDVLRDVQTRIIDSAAPERRVNRWRIPRLGAAAAVALMLTVAAVAPTLLPEPAWAVKDLGRGLVRVELSPVLGRYPSPGGLIEELRVHDIEAEVTEQSTWWPWEHGRIITIGWQIDFIPEALRDEPPPDGLADLVEAGILDHDSNGFSIDTERFEGTVLIKIGASTWSES